MQDNWSKPATASADLGYRGLDADNPDVYIVHWGKSKRICEQNRKLLKRRQAIEPIIGHLKAITAWTVVTSRGKSGDRLHAVLCAAGYNIRRLLSMIARKGVTFLRPLYLRLCMVAGVSPSLQSRVLCICKPYFVAGVAV